SVRVGFVDEEPRLAVAARLPGPALCLPFFAARNSHVEVDLPEALAEAGFPGPILPPVGTDAAVPRIIADGLARAALARVA
ncbi:MAG: cobalamin biosynthesis protein CbiX, partial [Rhodobacteraceae bacterium]|nr:cobalamin biosynthesis protein CbiX [Paracoccaceae bacterium]